MSEKNRREIPITDGNEKPEEKAPEQGAEQRRSGSERTVYPGSTAANVYRKQSGEEAPRRQSEEEAKEPEPEAEEKVERESAPEETRESSGTETEVQELRDQFLRLRAEFENFRKRTERERIQFASRANAGLMEELLPVLDHFQLALKQANGNDGESFRAGVELIFKQLFDTLAKYGLEHIPAEGEPFDPQVHEALMTEPSTEHEEGIVIQELQAGYTLKGHVLRPSRVKVSSGAPE
jgi:molecular chaperone GrpE